MSELAEQTTMPARLHASPSCLSLRLPVSRRTSQVPQLSSPPPREQQPSPASEGGASTEAQGAGASSSRGSEAGSQAGGQEVADLLGDEVPVQPPAAADSGAHADAQGPQAQAEQQQQQEEVKVDPARVEAGAMQVYSLLSSALEGPEVDLVTMSFERADVPAVWWVRRTCMCGLMCVPGSGCFD
jgi:hypothetical protein